VTRIVSGRALDCGRCGIPPELFVVVTLRIFAGDLPYEMKDGEVVDAAPKHAVPSQPAMPQVDISQLVRVAV
jgi:hypothetical protein